MGEKPTIEATGDHEYLVKLKAEEDSPVTLRVRANASTLEAVGGDVNEQSLVIATLEFLTERQTPDELPADLDLQDVADAYDEYIDHIRHHLAK